MLSPCHSALAFMMRLPALRAASMLFACKPKTTLMNIVEEVIEEASTYVEYQERVYCIPCGTPLKVTRTNLSVN